MSYDIKNKLCHKQIDIRIHTGEPKQEVIELNKSLKVLRVISLTALVALTGCSAKIDKTSAPEESTKAATTAPATVCICLFRLVDEVQWNNLECHTPVRTVLLLLAPRSSPKEHIEMISEISAALIEEDFIKTLIMDDYSTVKYKIKAVLGKGYRDKTTSVFRGHDENA